MVLNAGQHGGVGLSATDREVVHTQHPRNAEPRIGQCHDPAQQGHPSRTASQLGRQPRAGPPRQSDPHSPRLPRTPACPARWPFRLQPARRRGMLRTHDDGMKRSTLRPLRRHRPAAPCPGTRKDHPRAHGEGSVRRCAPVRVRRGPSPRARGHRAHFSSCSLSLNPLFLERGRARWWLRHRSALRRPIQPWQGLRRADSRSYATKCAPRVRTWWRRAGVSSLASQRACPRRS